MGMDRFTGLIGIIVFLAIALLMSNNRKAISKRLVISGLILQILLAVFVLKVPLGRKMFALFGEFIQWILDCSLAGARFCFGPLADNKLLSAVFGEGNSMVFAVSLMPTIIFICVLVAVGYQYGLLQRLIGGMAGAVNRIMRVSGSEALSNVASAFVGQVEAQILIRPYLQGMTRSELLASMTGSMACISGGVMAVYISMGVPAAYLLAASLMAAPGALVVSKIVFPETERSETMNRVSLKVVRPYANFMDAVSHGAMDGLRVSAYVIALLIGMIALITLADGILGFAGRLIAQTGISFSAIGLDLSNLKLKDLLGSFFSVFAWIMGVPFSETQQVGAFLGTKMVVNEFVAYSDMSAMISKGLISQKALIIASFALCGFANLGSVAIQVGGIGQLAPSRRTDLARLGLKAMLCGTIASYISASIAGILM
jgi:CNT family concentrative nucleoside transporter